jgi:hypothetical protein
MTEVEDFLTPISNSSSKFHPKSIIAYAAFATASLHFPKKKKIKIIISSLYIRTARNSLFISKHALLAA